MPACAGEHGPLRKDETPHDRWLKVQESAVMRVSFLGFGFVDSDEPRDPTMASDYNPLDDLPVQIRRGIASPVPSHFSIVTGSPSPTLVHNQHHHFRIIPSFCRVFMFRHFRKVPSFTFHH